MLPLSYVGFCASVSHSGLLGLTTKNMSEGESKQAHDNSQDGKQESTAPGSAGQGVSSVSPPVSMVTQPAATAATEDEEEESEDESEILEESPCGRWQKRREEVKKTKKNGGGGSWMSRDDRLVTCLVSEGESAQRSRH